MPKIDACLKRAARPSLPLPWFCPEFRLRAEGAALYDVKPGDDVGKPGR